MRRINDLMRATYGVFILVIIYLMLPQSVAAVTYSTSLTAMPAVIDTGGEAGAETSFSFLLTNNSESILPIQMGSRDSRAREGQTEELMRSLSAKDWIVYAEPDFILQAGETKQINARLKIPENANPGGHYTDIVVQPLNLGQEDDAIASQPELAVQVLVSVAGDIEEDLRVTLGGPSTVIFSPSAGNSLAYTVKNNGNIHTLFMPGLKVSGKEGEGTIKELPPEIILPGEVKRITATVSEPLKTGVYSAHLAIKYGTPAEEAKSPEVRVFALPFNPKLLFIVPLILIAIYAYRRRQRLVSAAKIIIKGSQEDNKNKR